MTHRTFQIFVVLALISIIGVIVTQVFWFRKAFQNNELEFNKNVNIALKEVVKGILLYNNTKSAPPDPVKQLRQNYFAVMVNDKINSEVLEHYLQSELRKFNIKQGFEYSIYDCANEQMVLGKYIEGDDKMKPAEKINLPKLQEDNYYFTVYFPHKITGIMGQMGIWIYSSIVVFLVLIFFVFSLFVIFKQKRLSEVQYDFINNMAHEVRTPLTTISISAQSLRNEDIKKDALRYNNYTKIIIDEALKLKNQIDRVLSISDNNAIMPLKMERLDLHNLLRETLNGFFSNLNNPKATFNFKPGAVHSMIYGDIIQISNLITNLLDNSVKYSKESIEINIHTENKNGRWIDIYFSDNGIGIDKEYQKKVFHKFFRVNTGNIHNVKGFGIGLNYVKQIAKAHKGKITLHSEPGKGTTFILTLPLAT